MNTTENKHELKARQRLEAELNSGEGLLAYTQSQTSGFITKKIYTLGLTPDRLIVMRMKGEQPASRVLNIWRDNIEKLRWSGLWGMLKIKLGPDTLNLNCRKRFWKKRAKAMATIHAEKSILNAAANMVQVSQKQLQQAQDFQELGFLNSAKEALAKTIQADPGLTTDAAVVSLQAKLAEQSLALRIGAGFFGITLLLLLVFAFLGGVQLNPIGIILLILTGYNLWRGSAAWRWWGVYLGIINALIFGVGTLAEGAPLEFLSWLAFGAAIVIVLTGTSQRRRTWIAVGIYAFGHLGLLVLAFMIAFISAMTESI